MAENQTTDRAYRIGQKNNVMVHKLVCKGTIEENKELFLGAEGFFPEPKEISFNCSCPDWALMCKHVAAALYGIGARFDENPLLFFELRGGDVGRFIDVALENRVESVLANADKPNNRIMQDEGWREWFGVGKAVSVMAWLFCWLT